MILYPRDIGTNLRKMIILDEEIRYPEKGDKFFIEKGEAEEISWLNKSFQGFGNYADSYQTGALNLIDMALNDKMLRDYHIYPVVFLIRHYLELRMKELIQGLNYCLNQNREFPKHHDIQNLWGEFKKVYTEIGENPNDTTFQTVDELIKEMSFFDPISMAFRYPVDKKGEKTQKLEYINLTNLKETFIRVSFVLDGVADLIANNVDTTEDLVRDVYGNYYE
jgi:hypothetical protein